MPEQTNETPVTHPMRAMGSKKVFCAGCQAVVDHTVGLDKNNEIIVACSCGRFLKFPLLEDPAELEALLSKHHEENKGQVSVEMATEAQKVYDDKFKKLMGIS